MTPTPPSPEDDILDLDGLGTPAQKPNKASTQESDFEKELEALFAEDLAQAEAAAAAKKLAPADKSGDKGGDEDALLLQDILDDAAPVPAAPVMDSGEDALDLSAFAEAEAVPADPAGLGDDADVLDLSAFAAAGDASAAGDAGDDADVLDLSAFAADGPLDLTPPADSAGGKDGGIDIAGLDSLISELGDAGQTLAAPAPSASVEPEPLTAGPLDDGPLDGIDMHGLDDVLDVPKAEGAAADEDALDLSLGDLLEEAPAAGPAAISAEAGDTLDLTLPDISEPEPGAVLSALDDTVAPTAPTAVPAPEAAPADMPTADELADAALSLVDADLGAGHPEAHLEFAAEPVLEPEPVLDLGADHAVETGEDMLSGQIEETAELPGELEGFDAQLPEVASEVPLDAGTLLEQVHAEAVLGAVAGAAVAVSAMPEPTVEPVAAVAQPAPAATQVILTPEVLAEMQKMLSELKHQVLGGSVTVVGMQGQLVEKEQIISGLEQRLRAAEEEASALRGELSSLRSVLEQDGRTAAQVKERLALLEDRQAQMDQDMRAEIERAVPREAAKVIREEIAALAESMND